MKINLFTILFFAVLSACSSDQQTITDKEVIRYYNSTPHNFSKVEIISKGKIDTLNIDFYNTVRLENMTDSINIYRSLCKDLESYIEKIQSAGLPCENEIEKMKNSALRMKDIAQKQQKILHSLPDKSADYLILYTLRFTEKNGHQKQDSIIFYFNNADKLLGLKNKSEDNRIFVIKPLT